MKNIYFTEKLFIRYKNKKTDFNLYKIFKFIKI